MTGGRKRGRPWKGGVYKDGSPLKGRGLSPLGKAVRDGQRQFFKSVRKQYRAGPHVSTDLVLQVLKFSDGDPRDQAERVDAEKNLSEAKANALQHSRKGGMERAHLNNEIKLAVVRDHRDLFDKVSNGKLSANRAAQLLRRRLTETGGDGWKPSIRTLNIWFAEYRRN